MVTRQALHKCTRMPAKGHVECKCTRMPAKGHVEWSTRQSTFAHTTGSLLTLDGAQGVVKPVACECVCVSVLRFVGVVCTVCLTDVMLCIAGGAGVDLLQKLLHNLPPSDPVHLHGTKGTQLTKRQSPPQITALSWQLMPSPHRFSGPPRPQCHTPVGQQTPGHQKGQQR